jgi:hypothetical protein
MYIRDVRDARENSSVNDRREELGIFLKNDLVLFLFIPRVEMARCNDSTYVK